jgi:TRAP-type C4-dicarboxylate transport system substrate-binding protein
MTPARPAIALTALVVAVAGCTARPSATNKAGGRAAHRLVLTLANTPPSLTDVPPVEDFVHEVAAVSHGALRIRLDTRFGTDAPDSELRLVRAVQAGKTDLGWTGSRVFDLFGVTSFHALTAPMLIDSYPLERAVMRSGIPEQMLPSLERIGLVGVAVFGDRLRRAMSTRHPLVEPAAWRGISFGSYPSSLQDRAITALSAHPVHVFSAYRVHALETGQIQGFEYDVDRYAWYGLATLAPIVSVNVVLWPQIDVVFANPRRFASLTSQQRDWLREAARIAASRAVARASRDRADVAHACAQGARFVRATGADLAALRQRLASVYRVLERDAQTRRFVRQILAVKRAVAAPPSSEYPLPAGCRR